VATAAATKKPAIEDPLLPAAPRTEVKPRHGIFVIVFMPTTVHIPPTLLKSVDRRAKALGVSRNRLIVRALEQAVNERMRWAPEFLERLRTVDRETGAAVDDLLTAVKQRRRSKEPRNL
jgi:predicted transcriptional regulator